MESKDVLVLVNGSDPGATMRKYVEKIDPESSSLGPCDKLLAQWCLDFRFEWPPTKWLNNIHTEDYAKSLGYHKPLVEGPAVVDRMVEVLTASGRLRPQYTVRWRYSGPLYAGMSVAMYSCKPNRYLLCAVGEGVGDMQPIIQLEVEQ